MIKKKPMRSVFIVFLSFTKGKKRKNVLENIKNWDDARNYLSSSFKIRPYRLWENTLNSMPGFYFYNVWLWYTYNFYKVEEN